MDNISFADNLDNISEENIDGFFVGWQKPLSASAHLKLLQGSSHFVLAVDNEREKVVGFVTALGLV